MSGYRIRFTNNQPCPECRPGTSDDFVSAELTDGINDDGNLEEWATGDNCGHRLLREARFRTNAANATEQFTGVLPS